MLSCQVCIPIKRKSMYDEIKFLSLQRLCTDESYMKIGHRYWTAFDFLIDYYDILTVW